MYCHVNGFGLIIGFLNQLHFVNTSNYSAIAKSHTLQFTTASTEPFKSPVSSAVVAWYRLPTADFTVTVSSRINPVPQLPDSKGNS
jgi:hypothetical protein